MEVGRREVLRYSGLAVGAGVLGPLGAVAADGGVRVVKTSSGPVSGLVVDGVHVFKGLPYGADTRTMRFMAPKKPEAWTAVRACTAWGARAPQQTVERVAGKGNAVQAGLNALDGAEGHYHLPPDEGVQSEDCLQLNVWTQGFTGKRAVVVYFHGGAYNNGTVNCDLYDGRRLCRRGDVVVVTVNHRLNAFGFLELASFPGLAERYKESGNVGMLDLLLALTWVRDNIGAFGGDPGRVTIFGQSGGGAKCATLMAMERAQGLFHRVLTMSGQQVWGVPMRLATRRARTALDAMGLTGPVTAEALDGLTTEQIQAGARTQNNWLPVVDGWVLARDPFDPDAPAMSARVAMVLGNTKDEVMGSTAWRQAELTWETLPAELGKQLLEFKGPYSVAEIVAAYRGWYPGYRPVDVYVAAVAAFRSWPGQVIEAERRATAAGSASRTWVYQMDYPSPTADGRAPHTEDLAFVFDNLELAPGMVGATAEEMSAAQPLADRMSGMLIALAKTGDPNCAGLPHWPVYGVRSRETMLFDRVSRVVSDPRGDERRMMVGAGYRQPGT